MDLDAKLDRAIAKAGALESGFLSILFALMVGFCVLVVVIVATFVLSAS